MIVQSVVRRVVAMVTTADPFAVAILMIVVQPAGVIPTSVAQHALH
jgi:hypothetical protein